MEYLQGESRRAIAKRTMVVAVRFANGGKSLLVSDATDHELVPTLEDLADGHRTPWKGIQTDAPDRSLFVATPDLKYYADPAPLLSSNLYIVDNLRRGQCRSQAEWLLSSQTAL
jgi:hypothetical protein